MIETSQQQHLPHIQAPERAVRRRKKYRGHAAAPAAAIDYASFNAIQARELYIRASASVANVFQDHIGPLIVDAALNEKSSVVVQRISEIIALSRLRELTAYIKKRGFEVSYSVVNNSVVISW